MQNSEKVRSIKDGRQDKEPEKKKEETTLPLPIPEKGKRIISVIFIECVISLVLLFSLFIIKSFMPDVFSNIREFYEASPFIALSEEEGIVIRE